MKRSHVGIGLLCLWTLTILAILSPTDDQQINGRNRKLLDYNGNAKWLHELPRKTINGQSIDPTLFLATSSDYYSSLASIAIVAWAFGVLAGIIGILYCIFRFACNKNEEHEIDVEDKDRKRVIISLIVLSVLLLAMVVVGLVGNSLFQPAMTDFFDSAADHAVTERAKIESIQPILEEINYNLTQLRGYVAAVTREGNSTVEIAHTGKSAVGDNNVWRIVVLSFTYAFVGVIIILSICSIIFKNGKVSMAAGLLGFFAMFLTWMNFGLHFPFSVVVADLCYDIDEYTIDRRLQDRIDSNGTYGGMNDLLQCVNFFNADDTYMYTFELQNRLRLKINQTSDLNEKAMYEQQVDTLTSLQPVALSVRNCDWIKPVLEPFSDKVCDSYLTGLVMIWATNFCLCIVLIPHVVFSLKGYGVFGGKDKDGFF